MQKLLFGAARDIITPPVQTTPMGFGAVFGQPFEAVHDDLFVRALVLRDGKIDLILLVFDLCFHDDSLADAIAAHAQARYGVARDAVLVHYTHTHFGPAVRGYDYNHYRPAYEEFLVERAKTALDRAYLTLRSGTMETARIAGDWNISRRLPVEGDTLFAPNLDGDRDPNLYLLRLRDEAGRVRALLCNYACHPSNGGATRTVSAEYPGRLCALLEAQCYGCTALFVQGAGSDAKLKRGAQKSAGFASLSFDEIDEVAASMARRVGNALQNGEWTAHTPSLAARRFTIPLPLDVWPREVFEREQAERLPDGKRIDAHNPPPGMTPGAVFYAMNAQYIVDHYDTLPDELPLSCGAAQLAPDLYIFTMGGEPCADIARVLERVLPREQFLFFGYADAIAYIPSDKLLREGGYEAGGRAVPEYRLKGDCRAGVDELYVKGFAQALQEIQDDSSQ